MSSQTDLEDESSPRILNVVAMCPSRYLFFNHTSYIIENLPRALDSIWPLSTDPIPIPFQNSGLNLASAYIKKYLATRDQLDWIHVIVKAMSYTRFLQLIDNDRGKTQTLAFSCWCDGGQNRSAWHRQHRHIILVTPQNHFEKHILPQILFPEHSLNHYYSNIAMQRIITPLRLVHTLGYLSQRRSGCEFNLNRRISPRTNKHFYIFKSLPIDYRKILVTQWEDGISNYLYQEKLRKIPFEEILEKPLFKVGHQWKQRIGDFHKLERNMVIPIEKRFAPTLTPTSHFLYLMNGKKLYFQPSLENEILDESDWIKKQIEGGNCFFDSVAEEMWAPKVRDQKIINVIMHKYHNLHLEQENARLRQENQNLKEKKVELNE